MYYSVDGYVGRIEDDDEVRVQDPMGDVDALDFSFSIAGLKDGSLSAKIVADGLYEDMYFSMTFPKIIFSLHAKGRVFTSNPSHSISKCSSSNWHSYVCLLQEMPQD